MATLSVFYILILILVSNIDIVTASSNRWKNKQSPRNAFNHYQNMREKHYTLHEISNEEEYNQYNMDKKYHHRYPPYYFTNTFRAIFGMNNYMEEDDSFDDDDDNDQQYSSDKTQLAAFLTSFFVFPFASLGIGRLYVGEWIGGTLKFVLFVMAFCLPFIIPCITSSAAAVDGQITPQERGSIFASITITQWIIYILRITMITWWLIDIILFATNSIPDNDGVYPQPW